MAVADLGLTSGAVVGLPAPEASGALRAPSAVGSPAAVKAPRLARLFVLVASVLLLGLYVLPLWSVRLKAPQYPEGLGMFIRINTVEGATEHDLDNINNLNHYIGMQRIDPESIPELRLMPWIVGGLVVTGLLTAWFGRRRLIYSWTGAFLVIALAGLVDFWKWEYDYGHNLDMETAVIKIPGMSYQPPLIGSKQLLNFTAISLPASGGLLAGVAITLALAASYLVWRNREI